MTLQSFSHTCFHLPIIWITLIACQIKKPQHVYYTTSSKKRSLLPKYVESPRTPIFTSLCCLFQGLDLRSEFLQYYHMSDILLGMAITIRKRIGSHVSICTFKVFKGSSYSLIKHKECWSKGQKAKCGERSSADSNSTSCVSWSSCSLYHAVTCSRTPCMMSCSHKCLEN